MCSESKFNVSFYYFYSEIQLKSQWMSDFSAIIWLSVRYLDFPGSSDGKASVYNEGDLGSIPGWGRCPGKGNGNLLQYWATSLSLLRSLEGLDSHGSAVKNLPALGSHRRHGFIPGWGRSPGEGNDNPLPYSCLENPMDRGAWQATVQRVAKSWTRLKWPSTHACKVLPGKEEGLPLWIGCHPSHRKP